MLNIVSSWKVDWTAIGAIATAAAVAVSLWIAIGERRHRKNYAEYLLKQDCEALRRLANELSNYAEYLFLYFHGESVDADEDERYTTSIEAGFSRLQYFGHSEQMYSYQDKSKVFTDLNAAVSVARSSMPKSIKIWKEDDSDSGDAVVEHFRSVAKELSDSVDAYMNVLN